MKELLNSTLKNPFYVVINPNYTATVRQMSSLDWYLTNEPEQIGEGFGTITKMSEDDTTGEFLEELNYIIDKHKPEVLPRGNRPYTKEEFNSLKEEFLKLKKEARQDAVDFGRAQGGFYVLQFHTEFRIWDKEMYNGEGGVCHYESYPFNRKWVNKIIEEFNEDRYEITYEGDYSISFKYEDGYSTMMTPFERTDTENFYVNIK